MDLHLLDAATEIQVIQPWLVYGRISLNFVLRTCSMAVRLMTKIWENGIVYLHRTVATGLYCLEFR